jgi:hypothetical protein
VVEVKNLPKGLHDCAFARHHRNSCAGLLENDPVTEIYHGIR